MADSIVPLFLTPIGFKKALHAVLFLCSNKDIVIDILRFSYFPNFPIYRIGKYLGMVLESQMPTANMCAKGHRDQPELYKINSICCGIILFAAKTHAQLLYRVELGYSYPEMAILENIQSKVLKNIFLLPHWILAMVLQ